MNGRSMLSHSIKGKNCFAWMDEHYPQPIDTQLKADLEAGRIDDRINRALADHKAGRTQLL